uniref:Uncharacterized protein n=1 Tax=Aegilops tauschii subsp. strangulata TaxID=200361 RepID=A0A453BE61_AEGTS
PLFCHHLAHLAGHHHDGQEATISPYRRHLSSASTHTRRPLAPRSTHTPHSRSKFRFFSGGELLGDGGAGSACACSGSGEGGDGCDVWSTHGRRPAPRRGMEGEGRRGAEGEPGGSADVDRGGGVRAAAGSAGGGPVGVAGSRGRGGQAPRVAGRAAGAGGQRRARLGPPVRCLRQLRRGLRRVRHLLPRRAHHTPYSTEVLLELLQYCFQLLE